MELTVREHISDGGSVDPEKNVALFNVVKNARAGGVPRFAFALLRALVT
jgi:hypothetical protein